MVKGAKQNLSAIVHVIELDSKVLTLLCFTIKVLSTITYREAYYDEEAHVHGNPGKSGLVFRRARKKDR